MNKFDLSRGMSYHCSLNQEQCYEAIGALAKVVTMAALFNEPVKIAKFGTFRFKTLGNPVYRRIGFTMSRGLKSKLTVDDN